jgi:uncharacterized membrane protein SpoIIM required for sporulation
VTDSAVRELDAFVTRIRKSGLRSLSDQELLDFGRAYRRAGALLSRARTAGLKSGEVDALNRLLASAYPLLHAQPVRKSGSILDFLINEFPRTFRREIRVVMLAALVFLGGVAVGAIAVAARPDSAEVLLGTGWREVLDQISERHVDNKEWMPEIQRPLASAQIMTNNIKVALMAFATGVLLCLGSFYVLGFNGLMMGAVAVNVHQHGVDRAFWGFVVPHGVVEIPAILISAAAGLIIGYALIAPGRQLRRTAVRDAARRAIPLVIGVVILLVEAGLVEGFISPRTDVDPVVKMGFGALIFSVFATWLILGGRQEKSEGLDGRKVRSNASQMVLEKG